MSTSPAVQIPNASSPAAAQRSKAMRSAAPATRGVEPRGGRVAAVVRARGRRRGQPGVVAGRAGAAAAARARRPRRARRRRAARRRSSRSSSAEPVWPSRTRRTETVRSSTSVACVGRETGEARQQRALAHDGDLRLAVGEAPARARPARAGRVTRRRPARRGSARARRRARRAMTWPGSPLPQLVSPHSRHSAGPQTASSEPQNCGVIPA